MQRGGDGGLPHAQVDPTLATTGHAHVLPEPVPGQLLLQHWLLLLQLAPVGRLHPCPGRASRAADVAPRTSGGAYQGRRRRRVGRWHRRIGRRLGRRLGWCGCRGIGWRGRCGVGRCVGRCRGIESHLEHLRHDAILDGAVDLPLHTTECLGHVTLHDVGDWDAVNQLPGPMMTGIILKQLLSSQA